MHRRRACLVAPLTVLLLALIPGTALAADTYADANSGNNSNDCLTPATACQTITGPTGALTKTGGSGTIRLETGSYAENVTLAGGVSLIADSSATPTIDPSTGSFVIKVTGPNTTIQGLTLSSNVTNQVELQLDDSAGSPMVSGNHFVDPTPTASDNQVGLRTTAQGAPTISHNSFAAFFHGIEVLSPSTGTPGVPTISGNDISGIHAIGDGIEIVGTDNATLTGPTTANVIGNSIHDGAPSPSQPTGVFVLDGGSFAQHPLSAATGVTMIGNRIIGGENGIQVIGNRAPVTLFDDVIARTTFTAVEADAFEASTSGPYFGGNVTITNSDIVNNLNLAAELLDNHLTIDSSIVRGGSILTTAGGGTATCTITFSDGATTSGGPCDTFQTSALPSFVNSAADDYHLTPTGNTALIDQGNPAAPPAGSTDIDGDPRAIDADATCPLNAIRDIGVDEVNNGIPNCPLPPAANQPTPTPTAVQGPTGQQASALKKCKKKRTAVKRRKCRKRARLLPV